MAELVLGPLLRHVSETTATVWVETDAACEVEVLGHRARTFQIAGHHYGLVTIDGLEPDSTQVYSVSLGGERRWREDDSPFPASVIRTLGRRPLQLAFGSCRVAAPHEPPYTDSHGVDALWALAEQMRREPTEQWPDVLLMLGDQVYADRLSPQTRAFIRSRRPVSEPPHEEVADFEEYTRLYRETWADPSTRWLLANLPSAMIFDDHDVHDDWNTSASWRAEMAEKRWWHDRITGAFISYWIYQHLGNLSPAALAADTLYRQVLAADDAAPLLHEFAARAAETSAASQWSYAWELGSSRLVVIDSRAGRVLSDDEREMIDEGEWRFIEEQMHGEVDHLLLATSLPYLLPRAIHDLEAWNEAVCAGAWGRLAARVGEQIRRLVDLEHWAAFHTSFNRLAELIRSVATGARGPAPASVVVLSGDVHHTYLAEARLGDHQQAAVYQVVCSPLRNSLPALLQAANRRAFGPTATRLAATLARLARVPPPAIEWRHDSGPWFENELATITLDGRQATLRLEKSTLSDAGPLLELVCEWRLAAS